MITIEQCRAARGLIGWTQQDLADASGLSKTAINNFEKGHSDIKNESLKAIRMAFISADVEFIGLTGIQKRTDHVQTLKGRNAFHDLINDIYETLGESGGEILISNIDERVIAQLPAGKLEDHLSRQRVDKITVRALCAKNQASPLAPLENSRWLPETSEAGNMPTIIYGDKTALELWEHSMIIIINSPEASNAERKRFESLWAISEEASAEKNKAATHDTARSL